VGFTEVEGVWLDRLTSLRNVVRQELIGRQLANHVPTGSRVLDVGCGQGTQALRLARSGCEVVGVDPSPDLLRMLRSGATAAGITVETVQGTIQELDAIIGARWFDVVCAHGLLMYFDERDWLLRTLARRLRVGGLLSVTVRNGDGLAFRPGLRGDWTGAIAAFDDMHYTNELGAIAIADRIDTFHRQLETAGFEVIDWYGVRVFTDAASSDVAPPDDDQLQLLLEAEDQAGRRDPYRCLASQAHFVARRTTS
jgi:S-adenosylmethionine-dependent methyltransferase